MEITTEMIKQLRDETSVSVMQCKKALEEAGGDMEKALMILKKKSSEIAQKKSDREASQGLFVVKNDGVRAILVKLNCETDFVAKNSDFIDLANKITEEAFKEGVEAGKAYAQESIPSIVQKVGENIQLGSIEEITGTVVGSYVHDGRIASIVVLSAGTMDVAKDIAMHIAAMNPEYKQKSDIPSEMLEKAREMFTKEVSESGKPQDIQEKMLQGKIDSYFKDLTLLDQPFFKNPDDTIGSLLEKNNATIDTYLRVSL